MRFFVIPETVILYYDKKGIVCSILSMYGSYKENMNFTLLDSSGLDISKEDLKMMLLKYFKIDTCLADQILDINANKT
jgi:hypothetical protein